MPVNLSVRNVDDEVATRIRARAASHGRSVESEVRAILAEAVDREPVDWEAFAARVASLSPPLTEAVTTDILREERERQAAKW